VKVRLLSIVLFAILISAVPLFAQSDIATYVSEDGLVTFQYPIDWLVEENDGLITMTNTAEAAEAFQAGDDMSEGMLTVIIAHISTIAELEPAVDPDWSPLEVIEYLAEDSGTSAEISEGDLNGFAGAQVDIVTDETESAGVEGAALALDTPTGVVVLILESGDEIDVYGNGLSLLAASLTGAMQDVVVDPPGEFQYPEIPYVAAVIDVIDSEVPSLFYTVNLEEGDEVTITLIASDSAFDPILRLYAPESSDEPEVVNDDSADSEIGMLNSRIDAFEVTESGDWTIEVSRFGTLGAGEFQLSIDGSGSYDLVPAGLDEPAVVLPAGETIRQWAIGAVGSSEYGSDSWSAAQATGEPNTDRCGDVTTAWASASSTGQDTLTLEYAVAVIPQEVSVYQTYNPGSIISISLITVDGETITLPESADPPGNTECPGVFKLDVEDVNQLVIGVVVELDQTIGGSWNEIDAVELVGAAAADSAAGWSGEITDSVISETWTGVFEGGETVTITVVATSGNLDPVVRLFSADDLDEPLAENDDSRDDQLGFTNSRIEDFEIEDGGEYIIVVTRFGGEGEYTLTVEGVDDLSLELLD